MYKVKERIEFDSMRVSFENDIGMKYKDSGIRNSITHVCV